MSNAHRMVWLWLEVSAPALTLVRTTSAWVWLWFTSRPPFTLVLTFMDDLQVEDVIRHARIGSPDLLAVKQIPGAFQVA
jgi:hypothetical protein